MARQVAEYKLHGKGTVPDFIDDGGYWVIDGTMIGITMNKDDRHIPESVILLSDQDLIDRIVGFDLMNNEDETLTTEEKTAIAKAWLVEKDISTTEGANPTTWSIEKGYRI